MRWHHSGNIYTKLYSYLIKVSKPFDKCCIIENMKTLKGMCPSEILCLYVCVYVCVYVCLTDRERSRKKVQTERLCKCVCDCVCVCVCVCIF